MFADKKASTFIDARVVHTYTCLDKTALLPHPSVGRLVVVCQISPADRPLSHCWAIVTAAGARRAACCAAGSPSVDRTRNRSKPSNCQLSSSQNCLYKLISKSERRAQWSSESGVLRGEGKRVFQAVATWVRPPPNPQAIRSPFPFFLLNLRLQVASLLPCSISFILSCPAGQIGSFLAGSKKRTIKLQCSAYQP